MGQQIWLGQIWLLNSNPGHLGRVIFPVQCWTGGTMFTFVRSPDKLRPLDPFPLKNPTYFMDDPFLHFFKVILTLQIPMRILCNLWTGFPMWFTSGLFSPTIQKQRGSNKPKLDTAGCAAQCFNNYMEFHDSQFRICTGFSRFILVKMFSRLFVCRNSSTLAAICKGQLISKSNFLVLI